MWCRKRSDNGNGIWVQEPERRKDNTVRMYGTHCIRLHYHVDASSLLDYSLLPLAQFISNLTTPTLPIDTDLRPFPFKPPPTRTPARSQVWIHNNIISFGNGVSAGTSVSHAQMKFYESSEWFQHLHCRGRSLAMGESSEKLNKYAGKEKSTISMNTNWHRKYRIREESVSS